MKPVTDVVSRLLLIAAGMACSVSAFSGPPARMEFPRDNAGLALPDGFRAMKVADGLGAARHIAIADNGDLYIALRHSKNGGGIVALRDTDEDGRADRIEYFGEHAGTGIGLHDGFLYHSSTNAIYRYKMPQDGTLVPESDPQTVVSGFRRKRPEHASKAFTFDDDGNLYVNVGAPSNSCQEKDRQQGSPGQEPCPLLEGHAGVWKYDAARLNQTKQGSDNRYATGLRNVVGLDWNSSHNTLYVMQHGRDQLHQNWPQLYSEKQGAELPAEELFKVNEGDDFGWPYSYYDQQENEIMLAPEYGGDGEKTIAQSRFKGRFEPPVMAFSGHWAPNGLVFYTADQFPGKYRHGAFIAFHGSWNRAPRPQEGYKIVFLPFEDGKPAGEYSDFATGFAGTEQPQPGSAKHRPVGLAVGPKGSLYVTDDAGGTVWRIAHTDK